MSEGSDPRQLDVAAGVLFGTADALHKAQVVPAMVRLPVYTMAKIDAYARRAGKSRNAVVNLLCEVGLEELASRVPSDLVEELKQLQSNALGELLQEEVDSQRVY
jgi:hypothetical protein